MCANIADRSHVGQSQPIARSSNRTIRCDFGFSNPKGNQCHKVSDADPVGPVCLPSFSDFGSCWHYIAINFDFRRIFGISGRNTGHGDFAGLHVPPPIKSAFQATQYVMLMMARTTPACTSPPVPFPTTPFHSVTLLSPSFPSRSLCVLLSPRSPLTFPLHLYMLCLPFSSSLAFYLLPLPASPIYFIPTLP